MSEQQNREIEAALARPFPAGDVKFRPGSVRGNRAPFLLERERHLEGRHQSAKASMVTTAGCSVGFAVRTAVTVTWERKMTPPAVSPRSVVPS